MRSDTTAPRLLRRLEADWAVLATSPTARAGLRRWATGCPELAELAEHGDLTRLRARCEDRSAASPATNSPPASSCNSSSPARPD